MSRLSPEPFYWQRKIRYGCRSWRIKERLTFGET
jgi:hypothetical protein